MKAKLLTIITSPLLVLSSQGAINFVEDFDAAFDATTQTNGAPTFGFATNILGWGESDSGTFQDFIGDTTTPLNGSGPFTPVGTATPGLGTGGFIYTELGTLGGDTGLSVAAANYFRDQGAGSTQRNGLLVELFSLPATDPFVFAEGGNDIANVLGVNLIGSLNVEPSGTPGGLVSSGTFFDVSTVDADARIFVRISNSDSLGTGTIAYVDNVAIASIPEPSSSALIGLTCLGLTVRRRR